VFASKLQVSSRDILIEDITCTPQSASVVQDLPGQPQGQVQVMNVEYLESSVGTETVVRTSPADGSCREVAVELISELCVDEDVGEAVVEAIDDVCDGEADDKDDDVDSCASDEFSLDDRAFSVRVMDSATDRMMTMATMTQTMAVRALDARKYLVAESLPASVGLSSSNRCSGGRP